LLTDADVALVAVVDSLDTTGHSPRPSTQPHHPTRGHHTSTTADAQRSVSGQQATLTHMVAGACQLLPCKKTAVRPVKQRAGEAEGRQERRGWGGGAEGVGWGGSGGVSGSTEGHYLLWPLMVTDSHSKPNLPSTGLFTRLMRRLSRGWLSRLLGLIAKPPCMCLKSFMKLFLLHDGEQSSNIHKSNSSHTASRGNYLIDMMPLGQSAYVGLSQNIMQNSENCDYKLILKK